MAIFPGDPVLLDDNPLSITEYFAEYERSEEADQLMADFRRDAQEIMAIMTCAITEHKVCEAKRQHSIIMRIKKKLTIILS